MSKKQINFDPNLLNIRKSKTLKNRRSRSAGKGNGGNIMSSLRKKIINQLNRKTSQEHKREKIQERQIKHQERIEDKAKNVKTISSDFNDSLNFLENTFSESNTVNTKKRENTTPNTAPQKTTKQSSLKKPTSLSGNVSKHTGISLELPESLEEYNIPSPESQSTITLNPAKNTVIRSNNNFTRKQQPNYGCLKNGVKPTYNKHRNVTIKNNNIKFHENLEQPVFIDANEPVTKISEDRNLTPLNTNIRENRSNVSFDFTASDNSYKNSIKSPSPPPPIPPTPPATSPSASPTASPTTSDSPNPPSSLIISDTVVEPPERIIDTISTKVGEKEKERINKPHVRFKNENRHNKTLRKIIVGKNGNKVSVLINDNKTRKKIKRERQSLKTIPIKQIKEFLKAKGLIEVGSNAPEDILRTLFENAKLSGEIENRNGEIYVNNYLDDRMNNTDEMGDKI